MRSIKIIFEIMSIIDNDNVNNNRKSNVVLFFALIIIIVVIMLVTSIKNLKISDIVSV